MKNKLCIISFTFNRSDYIERSFKSLYKRAGMSFDHYVFDDGSNIETRRILRKLKKKYNFKLFFDFQNAELRILKRFYVSYPKILKKYDYYVKFDSDTELLTDNFFPQILDIFNYSKEKIVGCIPRVEGIKNFDRHTIRPEFYGSHAIKIGPSIVAGCCMILIKEVFETLYEYDIQQIMNMDESWGIDSILLNHSLKTGNFVIVDDLSVYHIDNAYGQRRKYPEYFTNRKRWVKIDNDEVWFILASKEIYPKFIERRDLETLRKRAVSYDDFIEKCKEFSNQNKIQRYTFPKNEVIINKEVKKEKNMPVIEMYKITSPSNFVPTEYVPHGESVYFKEIPNWAKNNPSLVIEKTTILEPTPKKKEKQLEKMAKEKRKTVRVCKECGYKTLSLKRLKTHIRKKHANIVTQGRKSKK